MFRIADIEFIVEEAVLDAYIDDDEMVMVWGLEVSGAAVEKEFERWKPRAKIECIRSTNPGELGHWTELAGTSKKWAPKYNDDEQEIGLLYVFSHEPIYNSSIQLLADPKGLAVKWTGVCDIHWNEKYGQGLEFLIDTPVDFLGIWCGREPLATCLPLIQQFFSAAQYQYTQTDDGVSIFLPIS